MDVVEITRDNLESYIDYIELDAAENIGRRFFMGAVAVEDDRILAGMIWELINAEDENIDTRSRIDWLRIDDIDAGEALFAQYDGLVSMEGVSDSFFELSENDPALKKFMKNRGFTVEEKESEILTLSSGEFSGLKVAKKGKVPPYISEIGKLRQRLFTRGVIDCLYHIHRELPDDMAVLPLDWYDKDISCYEESDGNITGFLLVHSGMSGKLRIELLADWGPDSRSSLLNMIRFSIRKAGEKYPPDTEVIVRRHDDPSRKLSAYFFPKAKGQLCIAGQRKE